ncbi:MAG: WbqC family protein [Bacteroidales bacterium]|nr:WbqC family protein [Bacteroidales bacterium]
MLLTSAYCPPISWFALAARDFTLSGDRVIPSTVVLEASENYRKQSYRTRCRIAAAGGVETISVPIVHAAPKMPILSVKIDYSTPWLVRNERAIDSAYRTSAWFDYYRDSLYKILESGQESLFEYNLSLIRYFLQKTGIACEISLTDTFVKEAEDDFRYAIDPKKPDTVLRDLGIEKPYFQVFSGKYGFKENLSIMDLLFNEGPDSLSFLKG